VNFEELIISKDKIISEHIFLHKLEATVFVILQIFFVAPEISLRYSPILAGAYSVTGGIQTNRA